ncbi:feruloyl esterase [Aspergillus fijiensis CBS 313.89]|uniref:Carboxylic ester hydrolase n=1 Tax=Aspergillus fijiensis CBS 313.89 TaxID=1448319 RepID=A0A8G1RJM2_9EURO|nr:feruloyl esterase [Aspergillus fijiensis CBS 313.89]RAK75217.1 feruloyl esterase [Aspergillus fijiensis CBS 313.89]
MNLTCSPSAIQPPAVYGAEILNLSAAWVTNYTRTAPATSNYNHGDVELRNAEFCNITVTYTHPGYDDRITVETWLPRHGWNGRLQATGGGGWQAGRFVLSQFFMGGAIGEGYAATTTDAGLGDAAFPTSWALKSPGNVDYAALHNLGSRSLNDQAVIGKSLIRSFYGRDPDYSYWSGCSQGGRQGLMLAQRYPTAYDGIAASAPAQSWTKFVSAPYTSVNQTFHCSTLNRTIALSEGAAIIADAAWSGPRTQDGKFLWYGVNPGSDISSYGSVPGQNSTQADVWFNLFVAKNASFETSKMTRAKYERAFHLASQEYTDFMNAADPDLSEFRNAGGKLITYHGMADPSIPTKDTEFYYNAVTDLFPDVQEFYRFFEAPGLGHCSGGVGGQPTTTFDALRLWVENGTVPETLPVEYAGSDGAKQSRILCPYPAQAKYMGGDASTAESFRCV